MHDRDHCPLVRYASLDALGDQLFRGSFAFGVLKVPVARAELHRAERPHATVALVRASLIELDLPRGFFGSREQAAQHHAGSPRGDRLRDVSRISDTAIGDQWNVCLLY